MSLWFLFQGAGALPNTRNHGRGFAVPVLQCMGTGKPMLLLRASLDTCIAPSCDTENFDGPGEAVYSYGQTFLMALHREDGCSSHTGRFKQEQLNPGTFPACVEPMEQADGAWPLQVHRLCPSPLLPQLSATSGPTPGSSPGCCRRF